MSNFRNYFRFKPSEAKSALKRAHLLKSIPGLKLLQACDRSLLHGKLLIIIPRAFGSAPERNLLRRRLKAIYYEEKLFEVPIVVIAICYKQAQKLSFNEIKPFLSTGRYVTLNPIFSMNLHVFSIAGCSILDVII